MYEQVGNVKINLNYYHGNDQYSDGEIEDELLTIVQQNQEYEQIIEKDDRWPILYHLSKYRANIIEWYPFDKAGHVLEIGAGCGAITEALSKNVDKVTCVELSKKRSLINAYRNQERTNIEILVGDFNAIKFTEQYDYITLIGVLEYAQSFTTSTRPFHELLSNIKKLLKPNGKLFIAIENKFGLKYWAGAREDHTGVFFDSIENYKSNSHVKTFSKKELKKLLTDIGFINVDYYYPMPDYKFPFQIFSDKRLPEIGELRDLMHNFDRDRVQLFDEGVVIDSIIENNNFSFFSNSFLVICDLVEI